MRIPSLLISGGGIAGSTLGALVARNGFDVTIVERSEGQRSSGNPVDVHGPAFAVVEQLGVLEKLRSAATSARELTFVDDAGDPVARMAINRAKNGRHLEIPRLDLAATLSDAGKDDYEIIWDDHLTSIRQGESGVDVEFARTPPRRFDLVIGADGLHSGVRHLAFGPDADFLRRLGLYVATVRLDESPADLTRVLMHNAPGVSLTVHPATGTPIAAFIFRSPEHVNHRDSGGQIALLRSAYSAAGWRAQELLDAYALSEDVYFDNVSQVRMSTWSTGRVGLLGDSASSLSLFGDGSSSAIVGAATLAAELAAALDHDRDWAEAFRRYEKRHRRIIAPNVRGFAAAARLLVPKTRFGIGVRNTLLRTADRRPYVRPDRGDSAPA